MSSSTVDSSSSLNATHHGAAVVLTAAIALGTAVLTVGMRLYQKWPWPDRFKVEDAILVIAMVFSVFSTAAVAVAVDAGFGTRTLNHESATQAARMKDALTATFALAFATQGFAGCSFMLLLRSITPDKSFRKIVYILAAVIALWSLAAVIRFAAAGVADPSRGTWIGFSVISLLFQVVEAATTIRLIFPLKMALRWKIAVSFWFVLCIPSIIAAIVLRLIYTPSYTFHPDYAWNDVYMVIILIVETNLMTISAGCCSFRSLLNSLTTGFLVAETAHSTKMASLSNTGQRSKEKHTMRSLTRRTRDTLASNLSIKAIPEALRSEQYNAAVHGDGKSDRSFDSQAIMVRRSVEVAVDDAITPPA